MILDDGKMVLERCRMIPDWSEMILEGGEINGEDARMN